MDKVQLSIIVPVYNVQEYISRCAKSLLNQNVAQDNYEVVFVNDGTKDNSVEVLKEVVDFNRQKSFKIVNKKNGGLSSARNFGIDHSSGEYLWFVDSDDWIEPNSVYTILKFVESKPDIIFTSQMFRNVGETASLKYKKSINKTTNGIDILKDIPPSCAVAYICRRSFLDSHNFRFKEGICFEDSELTPKLLYYAATVICTDIPLYHHYMREGSITHNISQKSIRDYKIVLESYVDFFLNNVTNDNKVAYATDISSKIIELLDYSMMIVGKKNKDLDNFFYANKTLRDMLTLSLHKPTHLFGLFLKLFSTQTTLLFYIINIITGRKVVLR